jgi:hypothetical protein
MEQPARSSETIDKSQEFGFGPLDVVFGVLTLPLLFWALMYAVTGHERLYATRAARMKLYLVLLAIEVVLAAVIVWLVMR